MKKKTVTIKTIAETLGLSPGTVSLVLNGRGDDARISEKTQAAILSVAAEMGYSKTASPYKQTKPLFAVFCPMANIFTMERFALHTTEFLSPHTPFEFIFQPYMLNNLAQKKDKITADVYDGIIFCGMNDADFEFLNNHDFNVPIVLYNRYSSKYICVVTDSFEIGTLPAKCFHEHGHRHVAYIYSQAQTRSNILKKTGFNDVFQHLTGCVPYNISTIPEDCYERTIELLSSKNRPTAIFCDDRHIPAIYAAIADKKLKIPQDIEIISDGDHQWNVNYTPAITSLRPPIAAMVQDCFNLLLNDINNHTHIPVKREHAAQIIYRDSCPETRHTLLKSDTAQFK